MPGPSKRTTGLTVLPTTPQQPAERPAVPRPRRQRPNPQLTSSERMRVYEHVFLLNQSFDAIVQRLKSLARTGFFRRRDLTELQGLAQEVQGEINTSLLDPLHAVELDDWAHFGKTHTALERRLRGDDPPPPPKKT